MEFKEYIVTLHKHEDLDSFYEDMETPGGNLYIPDRAVEIANRRPISRNTHYWLTVEEAIQLKSDPRVWDVSLTPEELGLVPVSGWIDTNGYYSKDTVTTVNDRNWGLLRGFDKDHVSGWGSDGATKARTSTLDSKLNGTNVDFVVFGHTIASSAPEFAVNADGTGGSRYFYVNWGDYGLGSLYTQSPLVYSREGEHETICASIALGNTQGWARKARFTSIPYYTTYYDYVRAWHQAKSINSETGFKNPTVVTDSFGGNYGIDATAITSITYRGTTYNGPFDTSTDFSQYKLWLNTTGDTVYNQANGRVVFSNRTTAQLADIEDLVAAGVIFVGIAHNWRAYHAVENDQDWNNSITWSGGNYYYNRGTYASATGAIQAGAIMDLASNTPSPRSGRGPRVNIWAPSRTTGYSFYAGETPDGTGLGFDGGSQTDPASQGYLPMVKNSRDPRNSNYYIVKTTDGTSFSAPQVAGVIGLWAELKPNLTPAEALALLQTYGDVTGVVSTSANYGDWTSTAGATALALGFSPPTFNISASTSSVNSNQSVTYTITTTNVPNGSTLYLKEAGTAIASDFTDNSTQFTVTINSNSATITRTISSTSVSKTSILELKTGGYNGTVQTSSTVYINTALGSLTNFLNSYQSDFSYINLLGAADLTAAGSAYAMPAEISTSQISVASYGATGDGTDQTTKIQAALNGGSGKTVYFPPGTYVVSSTLTIPANTRLLGDNVLQNTVIKASSSLPAGSPLFTSSGNITYIQKIVIDGNNNPNRTEGLLFFHNVRYVYLIQSIIQNTSHIGMAAGGCRDVRVWGCKFENCGSPTYSQGISTPAFWSDTLFGIVSRDVYLEKNLFLNNNWSAAYLMPTGGYFKDNLLVNNKESGVYSNQNANFVVYENNYIYGQRRQNISASGIEIDGGINLTIRNNIIHNCGNDGISLQNSNGSTIENNTCYDNGAEYTFAFFGTASGIMLYSTNSAGTYNCIIRYNRCYNTTGTQRYGIYLYRQTSTGGPTINNCTITNNNNYSNAVSQISNNTNAVGGTTTIASNISNSASTTEGASGVSATVQNIFNTSLKTFSITASPTTGEPNTVITYTINTTLIPNGIKLYLQEIGSASATDFQWIDNVVAINNNSATITRTIGNITSAKTSTLSLREGSISGTSRATVSVGLTATSKTYNVYPDIVTIGESKSVTFTVVTTGVTAGTLVYYKITGSVTAGDFSDNSLTGSITIGSNGRGQVTKTLLSDSTSDNNESIVFEIYNSASYSTRVATTSGEYAIFAKDTNAVYNLSASIGTVNEQSQPITFTLQTRNIPPGTTIPYSISGVSSSDFVGSPSMTGNFTVPTPVTDYSNYGEIGGWKFYPSKQIGSDVTSVFIRGNEVIISDEIFFNPTNPSNSTVLNRISNAYKALGYRTGVTVTPVSLTHNFSLQETPSVSESTLISTIIASGVDFVGLDPYLWPSDAAVSRLSGSLYWDTTRLVNWASSFKSTLASNSIDTKIILQGFRYSNQTTTEVNNHNNSLLALAGIEEYIVFGVEDAPEWSGLSDPVTISNDFSSSTLLSTVLFTTTPDAATEGVETMTMTITGPGTNLEGSMLPLNSSSGTLSASVSIIDSSITPVPTYTLTTSVATVNEGQSVTITLATTNVAAGTTLPWTVTGITSGDLSSGSLTGNFVVGTTNTASFTFSNDTLTEGSETLTLSLDNGQATVSVTISDTSTAPVPTYTLTNDSTNNRINEGQTVVFTLATTNVSAGTSIPWTVTGITSGDLSSGSLTGNFVVGTTDTATFTLANDVTAEGTERLTLTLNGKTVSSYVDVIDTSIAVGAPSYTLTNDATSPVNEGTVITFTLQTTNVSSGTLVPWEIRGTGANPADANDFVTATSGSFVINSAGQATLSVTVKSDLKTENTERFRLRLTNNVAIYNDIDITDTSFPASTYTLTANKSSVNEGEDLIIFLTQTPYSADDSVQSYTVTGITSADIDTSFSAVLTGSFNLQDVSGDGKDSKTFRIKADSLTDAGESFTLTLTGIRRSESITIPINDTSTTPGLSYSLASTAIGDSINEGDTVTFHLGTSGVGSGASLGYTVTGINAADLSSGSLTGNFSTNVNGGASVSFTLSNDLKLEGNETLTLSLNNGGATKSITVVDTSYPTYTLSGAPAVAEGSSITITLTTTGLSDGDLVPYTITGINAVDLSAGSLTGNFIINPTGSTPNVGTISLTLANDLSTEGPETFYVNLNNGLAAPHAVTVTDTSVAPPATPSYSLFASDNDINEGDTVLIVLSTTNVSAGTSIPYTITGISSADLVSGSLTGNFTTNAAGQASVTLTLNSDSLTEGVETLRLKLDSSAEYVDVIVRDTSLTPAPTLPTYSLTANSATLREGESVVIILSVTNLGIGVNVPYVISGVSTADIDRPLTGGSFVINSAGKAAVTINAIADFLTEGTETLRLTIYGTSSYLDIPVADISTGFPTYTLTANASTYNEGDTAVIILSTTSLPSGTSVPYTIVGVGPGDIGGASLTGNFTTNATGFGNVVLSISSDGILEGSEFLNLSLNGRSEFITVFINDTSKPAESYLLSSTATVVSEGSSVNITLLTTGVVQNTIIPYTISGTVDTNDYSLSSGRFIIDQYGNSTIIFNATKDFDVEGTETFKLSLTDRPQTNITILVTDFSYQVTVPSTFSEIIPQPPPPVTLPPGFNVPGITTLGDAIDKPSSLAQKLLPEFTRGG